MWDTWEWDTMLSDTTAVGHYEIVCLYGEDSGLYGESAYKMKDAYTARWAYTVKDA